MRKFLSCLILIKMEMAVSSICLDKLLTLHSIKSEGSSSKPESQDVEKNKKPLFEVKERFFDDEHKGNHASNRLSASDV